MQRPSRSLVSSLPVGPLSSRVGQLWQPLTGSLGDSQLSMSLQWSHEHLLGSPST